MNKNSNLIINTVYILNITHKISRYIIKYPKLVKKFKYTYTNMV